MAAYALAREPENATHFIGAPAAVVLKPLSHPTLGEIRVGLELSIGRNKPPFDSYDRDLTVDLSRQHARIACAGDVVYLEDLGSTNGTTINNAPVQETARMLADGDEVCFGGVLTYRVELTPRTRSNAQLNAHARRIIGLTLAPERNDLEPIVIHRLPLVIGKSDAAFARYQQSKAEHLSYLSRHHARFSLRDGRLYIEDLGSTNGTSVDGTRLDNEATPLGDGARVALGGGHFIYRVCIERELPPPTARAEPVTTALVTVPVPAAPDRTMFIAAPASFLDIFCAEPAPPPIDVAEQALAEPANDPVGRHGKPATLFAELRRVLASTEHGTHPRRTWIGALVGLAFGLIIGGLYWWGATDRDLKSLVASGAYEQAATMASELLQREPDNADYKALGTEAALKAHIPDWLNKLAAQDFAATSAALAKLRELGRHNADLNALLDGLAWMGDFGEFTARRGSADAPIRIYADEERIRTLLKRWDDDNQNHQRALSRVAAHSREFRSQYAEVLTQLRKLQSESLVDLAAIDRLKVAINAELNRDAPEALLAVLQEYTDKYPRLGGLDDVRRDLQQYIELVNQARARDLSRLVALMTTARLATPPFAAKSAALAAGNRLPSADVVTAYQAVATAWRTGDAATAIARLQPMTAAGPWADAAARELARKKALFEQFGVLTKMRDTGGHNERLLAFNGLLDPDEDRYFVRAIESDLERHRGAAVARAEALWASAQTQWQRYRDAGAIDGRLRLESGISNRFRRQAELLGNAHDQVQTGRQIYAQLRLTQPPQWTKLADEIKAELALQRTSLLALRTVVEPGLLKAKLALIRGTER